MKDDISQFKEQLKSKGEQAIEEFLSKLNNAQREAVQVCIDAANSSVPTGIRYTNAWILECIFLRIKSRRAYEHIRKHKILQVPTIDTLNKYMKSMKPSYGFQEAVFELLKYKSLLMEPFYRRGLFNLIIN